MKRLPTTVGLIAAGLVFATAADSQYRLTLNDLMSSSAVTPVLAAEAVVSAFAFEVARNTEIEASIHAYKQARRQEFAAARNAEVEASLVAYSARRESDRKAEIAAAEARYHAELEAAFAFDRNQEAEASVAAYKQRREDEALFSATRNAELELSVSRVKYAREQEVKFVAERNAEIELSVSLVQQARAAEASFAAARNAEIEKSVATYEAARRSRFAAERNAEIETSIARVRTAAAFAAERNREVASSVAAYEKARQREFATARNAEIEASIAASNRQRAATAIANLPGNRSIAYVPVAIPVAKTGEASCKSVAAAPDAIRFQRSSAKFDKTVARALQQVAEIARSCPGLEIEIRGYTDASGSASANRKLSARRATAAARYLIETGVGEKRVTTIGLGSASPIAPNNSASNRALNRRIEFAFRQTPAGALHSADASR